MPSNQPQSDSFERLLAKSSKGDEPKIFLQGHTGQVLLAADALLAEVADNLLRQLGLDTTKWLELFRRAVRLGAFIHDFGKANNHFQRAVRSTRYLAQGIRHEALSAILCTQEPMLRKWLCPDIEQGTVLVFRAAVLAAVGHHLKTKKEADANADPQELIVYLDRDDFRELAKLGTKKLGLETLEKFSSPLELKFDYYDCKDDSECVLELERLFREEAEEWFKEADDETRVWLAAVKAMVVSADVAGSAIPTAKWQSETRVSIRDWVASTVKDAASAEEFDQIVKQRLGRSINQAREDFQRQVEESKARITLVRAGCGAGKTIAAYRWAVRRAAGRKLFFCYPTTGTASQGFEDYISKSKIEGELIHSRSAVDLARIEGTPDDIWDENGNETADLRIESLQAWEPPLVVCTVDAVLGLMQNNRRGLYSFPAFANAAFVFDEIHAYDPMLFGALLGFLKTFREAPIMLMTASLPTAMQTALEKVCGELKPHFGPHNRETAPRYSLEFVQEAPDAAAWKAAKETLRTGGKVLWIVNTVDRAIGLYRAAKEDEELYDKRLASFLWAIYLYHSRFRYFERVLQHKAVVDAFNPRINSGAVMAITTQVAEMSLDLSADLLITDIAPPAALVQRMGRLNRNEDEPRETKRAIVLDRPDNPQPYTEPGGKKPSAEFALAYKWLETLKPNFASLSQQQLARELETVSLTTNPDYYQVCDSSWLNGLWQSQIEQLRDAEGTVPIVLEPDVPLIRKAGNVFVAYKHRRYLNDDEKAIKRQAMKKEAIRRSLSIPARSEVNQWSKLDEHKLFRIAKSEHVEYNEETGAQWKPKNKH